MLVVCREALELVLCRVAGEVEALGLGEEDAEDGLEEGRVEVERDVDEGVSAFLQSEIASAPVGTFVNCITGRLEYTRSF